MDEHRNSDDGLHCISACFLLISCDTFSDQTNDTLSSFFYHLLVSSLSISLSGDSGVKKRISHRIIHCKQKKKKKKREFWGPDRKLVKLFPHSTDL